MAESISSDAPSLIHLLRISSSSDKAIPYPALTETIASIHVIVKLASELMKWAVPERREVMPEDVFLRLL